MFASRKCLYSPHKRNLKFLGVGGRPNILRKCMELNWNLPEGWGVLGKNPSVGEVWLIFGTTQWVISHNARCGIPAVRNAFKNMVVRETLQQDTDNICFVIP